MKILHIVSGELNGGAARGAYWLHRGLRKIGVDSYILTNSFDTLNDPEVLTTANSKKNKVMELIRGQLDAAPSWLYRNHKRVIFSTGFFGKDFTKTEAYKMADIIHLHWINAGFVNMRHFKKIKKPMVWTMRDMWPMTGGCHYAMECIAYETGCGKCPQLGSKYSFDLSKIVLSRKKKYIPKDIKLVGISTWLSECASKSSLFHDFDIRTIPNNVDCHEFYPIPKDTARKLLGLPLDKRIILAGAQNMNDFHKGFNKYIQSLFYLENERKYLLFFGKLDISLLKNSGFEYTSLGFLNDTISLRLAYSAADVFVAPSLMDAFGKTLAESMACGTPVVCFNATGPKDIVDHKKNGYLAYPFDPQDLARGVKWVLEDEKRFLELSINAREKVEDYFDIQIVAKQYQSLYQEILNE